MFPANGCERLDQCWPENPSQAERSFRRASADYGVLASTRAGGRGPGAGKNEPVSSTVITKMNAICRDTFIRDEVTSNRFAVDNNSVYGLSVIRSKRCSVGVNRLR